MKKISPEQVAKMRPEARERYEQRLKIVMRNRKILTVVSAVLCIALVFLALSMTVLFNIKSITVASKSAIYTDQEILSASGIDVGNNMLRTDFDKVCERIEKNLPYIYEATVTKKLSGDVVINVKDTAAKMIIQAAQGYAVADADGKVLEIIKQIPEDCKLMIIKTVSKPQAAIGEMFTLDDETEKELYDGIVKNLKDAGLFSKVSLIDITNRASIKIEYQHRMRLLIGTSDELDVKLKSAAEIIKAEDAKDPTTIAEINLTIPKKAFVNSLESLDEPEASHEEIIDEEADANADESVTGSSDDGESEEAQDEYEGSEDDYDASENDYDDSEENEEQTEEETQDEN